MQPIEELIAALTSSDSQVREEAKDHLVAMGSAAVEPLLTAMREGSGKQSWRAVKTLAQIKDARIFDILSEALTSTHPIVRETAATELGKLGDPRAVPLLLKTLDDSAPNVQLWALQALRDLNDAGAVPTLIEKLPQMTSASLRYTLIEVLGVLGDKSAIPAIEQYRDDEDHHVRDRVAAALKRLRVND